MTESQIVCEMGTAQKLSQRVSQCIEATLKELAEFAVRIRTHHEHATQTAEKAIEHARLAGECLIQLSFCKLRYSNFLNFALLISPLFRLHILL
jgi:hypothetical protein